MIDKLTRVFIKEHLHDDVRSLALQAARYPQINMRTAVTQIEGRRIALTKLPEWATVDDVIYPVRLSLEQCSSEITARYKASLVNGTRMADLTGGFGIDCSYMSDKFEGTTYIERNEELCKIAEHNFSLLKKNIRVVNGDSTLLLESLPQQDWIFVDPARRDGAGNKVVLLSDCIPNVCQLEPLLLQKAAKIMVKCSPMLDVTQAVKELHSVCQIHVVSVNNECKELLIVMNSKGNDKGEPIVVFTVNIQGSNLQHFSYKMGEELQTECLYTSSVGRYLYEPNSSIMKAGCFRLLAAKRGIFKLHPNSHLYTSDTIVTDFPGRVFEVKEVYGFSKKELKRLSSDVIKANVAVRNFPATPKDLYKRLKLAEGGDSFLFATTLANEEKIIVVSEKTKNLA